MLTLWHWYQEKQSNGYAYTQFTRHYNLWAHKHRCSAKLDHKAGEKLFVDYAGKKLSIVDKITGEVSAVEVFVGILPSSQYTFVEASMSQKREDLIGSLSRCKEYFGGVTQAIVSDNLKSASAALPGAGSPAAGSRQRPDRRGSAWCLLRACQP